MNAIGTRNNNVQLRPKLPGLRQTAWLKRVIVFATLWWILAEGTLSSWLIGAIVVPIAAWLSLTLFSQSSALTRKRNSVNFLQLLLFAPYFLFKSLQGGLQTARLALHTHMPIRPGLLHYDTCLPDDSSRLFFLHVLSTLPGTVSAKLEGDRILIHALDTSSQSLQDFRICEQKVARIFNMANASDRLDSDAGERT